METVKFQLKDQQGTLHEYEVVPHPATEGIKLFWQIMGLASGPLGKAIDKFVKNKELIQSFGKQGVSGLLDSDIFFKELDIQGMLESVRQSLSELPMEQLSKELFRYTVRDKNMDMANDANFARAYQANYMEYLQALWKIVQANHFLSLRGITAT